MNWDAWQSSSACSFTQMRRAMGMAIDCVAVTPDSAGAFAIWLKTVLEGQGEDVACESAHGSVHLHVERWRLGEGLGLADPAGAFVAWNELWAGACAAHARFLQIEMSFAVTDGVLSAHWPVRPDAAGAVST